MTERERIRELVGVYDADGTVRGEMAYWLGARIGRAHCSLCDITHGLFRERADWNGCRSELPVPFVTHHRDDQPADVRAAAAEVVPVVVARTEAGVIALLGPAELDACGGSPELLVQALRSRVEELGLVWP